MGLMTKIKKLKRYFEHDVKVPTYIPILTTNMLQDINVLITGGSGGIGYAIADALLRNGANIVICGRNLSKLQSAVNELRIKYSDKVIDYVEMDISNNKSIINGIGEAVEKCPNKILHAVVNNAGVSSGMPFGNTNEDCFDLVIDTNLRGTYFVSQSFSNYLIKNHIAGRILNISSASGVRPSITPYMLSKRGIIGLTEGMGKKLIKYGIVVNGIAPGPTATEMLDKTGEDLMYDLSPAKRYVDVNEIGNWATILLSDLGQMLIGETIFITGGCGTLTKDDIKY